MSPAERRLAAHGWTITRLVALVWRLVHDLAQARGYTLEQMARHYCLPDRPYMGRTEAAPPAAVGGYAHDQVPPVSYPPKV